MSVLSSSGSCTVVLSFSCIFRSFHFRDSFLLASNWTVLSFAWSESQEFVFFPPDFFSNWKDLIFTSSPSIGLIYLPTGLHRNYVVTQHNFFNTFVAFQIKICSGSLVWDLKCFVTCAWIAIPALSFIFPLLGSCVSTKDYTYILQTYSIHTSLLIAALPATLTHFLLIKAYSATRAISLSKFSTVPLNSWLSLFFKFQHSTLLMLSCERCERDLFCFPPHLNLKWLISAILFVLFPLLCLIFY